MVCPAILAHGSAAGLDAAKASSMMESAAASVSRNLAMSATRRACSAQAHMHDQEPLLLRHEHDSCCLLLPIVKEPPSGIKEQYSVSMWLRA
jgi:hypothetical protein